MSECPSSTLRNTRKHFVKCVDCHCHTLPQNASAWTAASTLYLSGRVNDGALCGNCANKRREALGLPVVGESSRPAPACDPKMKTVRVNRREYTWEVSTLESVLAKWRDEYPNPRVKKMELARFVVTVNTKLILAADFSSTTISDGDEIVVSAGAVAGG
jgi:sulfur carrier protein ThiS